MKKICFLLPEHWSSAMGGAEFQVKCLIEKLIKTNLYEIYYLTRNYDKKRRDFEYKIVQISKNNIINKYGYFFDSYNLLKLLKKIEPDIIYQRVGCAYTGIAAFYKKKRNCKLVWHIAHDSDVERSYKLKDFYKIHRIIERKIFQYGIKNCDHIIAQTERQKNELIKNYDKIFNITKIQNFHPIPKEKYIRNENSVIKVLWVANLKKIKQPGLFIQLAKDISVIRDNVVFTMIGKPAFWDSRWQDKIEKEIAKVDKISYLGYKSIDDVNKIMQNSDIFVNTSIQEGFPNTFIQAWMRKVPIVSLHADPDDILKKDGIGLYSGDYNNLLNNVLKLIDNKKIRDEISNNAYDYVKRSHSLKNIDGIINVFDKI